MTLTLQDSLEKRVDETVGRSNTVQLNVVRGRGRFGRVVVRWVATGAHDGTYDITPVAGTVEFANGQEVATISITVLDDTKPELDETSRITLTEIVTPGTSLKDRGAVIGRPIFTTAIFFILFIDDRSFL